MQSFTARMSLLMAANQRIRIREKTLEFSSTVLCTLSPYLRPLCALAELIPVLGSQSAGDVSHKPGGRLPLLSARPAVTIAALKRATTSFAAW